MKIGYYSAKHAIEVENTVTDIIAQYHLALDNREHGGVAQDRAIKAIEKLLEMPYEQGRETKRAKLRELQDELGE